MLSPLKTQKENWKKAEMSNSPQQRLDRQTLEPVEPTSRKTFFHTGEIANVSVIQIGTLNIQDGMESFCGDKYRA